MSLTISHTAAPTSSAYSGTGGCCERPGQGEQAKAGGNRQELSQDEQQQVDALKQRDREVRAHEAAHLAASGGHARGGANFSYKRGPDGKLYAVGGEVSIDVSPVSGDPEATIRKAQAVQRAALAPAEPSGQDRSVAAQAAAMATQARQQLAQQHRTQIQEDGGASGDGTLMARIRADGAAGGEASGGLHLVA